MKSFRDFLAEARRAERAEEQAEPVQAGGARATPIPPALATALSLADPAIARATVTTNIPAQDSQQALKAEPATAEATACGVSASSSPSVGSMGSGQAADAAPVAEAELPPTLNVGQINALIFPVSITASGIVALGIAQQRRPGMPGSHFLASDAKAICRAIGEWALAKSEMALEAVS